MNQAAKPENIPTPEIAEAPPRWRFRLNPAQCALGSFALACLAGAAVVMWPQAAGAGGLALHGADRAAHDRGGLGYRQVTHEAQHYRRPLPGRQRR